MTNSLSSQVKQLDNLFDNNPCYQPLRELGFTSSSVASIAVSKNGREKFVAVANSLFSNLDLIKSIQKGTALKVCHIVSNLSKSRLTVVECLKKMEQKKSAFEELKKHSFSGRDLSASINQGNSEFPRILDIVIDENSLISSGNFGSVYDVSLTVDPLGCYVGKKMISEADCKLEYKKICMATEVNNSRSIKSPGIALLDNIFYLIMKKAKGVSGINFLLSEEKGRHEVEKVAFELLAGIEEIHENGFCHGDINLENFYVNESKVTIIDFGFSDDLLDCNRVGDIKKWANVVFRLLTFGEYADGLFSYTGKTIELNETMVLHGDTVAHPFYHVSPTCNEDPLFLERVKSLHKCMNFDEVILHVMTCSDKETPPIHTILEQISS